MTAWRYEISLLVLKKYSTRSLRSLVKYFSTLEEKFRIFARPCNILYICGSERRRRHPAQNKAMKEKIRKEYYRQIRLILKSELYAINRMEAINTLAVAIVSYGFNIIN